MIGSGQQATDESFCLEVSSVPLLVIAGSFLPGLEVRTQKPHHPASAEADHKANKASPTVDSPRGPTNALATTRHHFQLIHPVFRVRLQAVIIREPSVELVSCTVQP
jgi:hypothetical protein